MKYKIKRLFLPVIGCLFLLLVFGATVSFDRINYGLVHRDVISENEIRFMFYIKNDSNRTIKEGTKYKIRVNRYEGEITMTRDIKPGNRGKGYILIFGDKDEQRFSDILISEISEIDFRMEKKQLLHSH